MIPKRQAKDFRPEHFELDVQDGIATFTLSRPERKNPLTFGSYAEMSDTFRALARVDDVKVVIVTGAGGNFCSGGDVHEIIGPLTKMDMAGLLEFTRMTGELIKSIRYAPQPVIAAIDGVCVGGGAAIAMAADMRIGTPTSKVAFLFNRVGLAGCDMGACAMLPRIIGHGRAAELLYTGRSMLGDEALQNGFYNQLVDPDELAGSARALAQGMVAGPTFAHSMTKRQLDQEWSMSLGEAIEHEAQSQAICMQTKDFTRAFEAFAAKERPVFQGD